MIESKQCPACGSEDIDYDREFAWGICADCGFVIADSSNAVEPEPPEAIDVADADEPTKAWPQTVEAQDKSDQNLIELLTLIDTLGEPLLLSDEARVRSAELATKAWENSILHGRSKNACVGAAVRLACRELRCPRPIRVIADIVQTDVSSIQSIYQLLIDTLAIDLDPPKPGDYVLFICESLECTNVETSAQQLLHHNREYTAVGDPSGIAAAAVYIATQEHASIDAVTYREVGKVVGMTKETVWKRATELR